LLVKAQSLYSPMILMYVFFFFVKPFSNSGNSFLKLNLWSWCNPLHSPLHVHQFDYSNYFKFFFPSSPWSNIGAETSPSFKLETYVWIHFVNSKRVSWVCGLINAPPFALVSFHPIRFLLLPQKWFYLQFSFDQRNFSLASVSAASVTVGLNNIWRNSILPFDFFQHK
jgi:hypothetical protein